MKNNIRLLVEGFFDDEIFNKKDDIKTDLEDIGDRYYKIDPENPKYWQVGDILYSVYNYSMIPIKSMLKINFIIFNSIN